MLARVGLTLSLLLLLLLAVLHTRTKIFHSNVLHKTHSCGRSVGCCTRKHGLIQSRDSLRRPPLFFLGKDQKTGHSCTYAVSRSGDDVACRSNRGANSSPLLFSWYAESVSRMTRDAGTRAVLGWLISKAEHSEQAADRGNGDQTCRGGGAMRSQGAISSFRRDAYATKLWFRACGFVQLQGGARNGRASSLISEGEAEHAPSSRCNACAFNQI